jgi:predicted dehydrogenase
MTTPDSPAHALGVAVIGHSFMGRAHSNAWRNVAAFFPDVPPVRQAVLVGRDPARVAAAGAQLGWDETATDWRGVLERADVDIVDVCLPGHLHAEVAQAALAAGKHVLVEKPLANDVAEAESMTAAARAARERGVRSMVGFNYRRVPALELARAVVADGRIGTLRQVRICYLQDWLTDEKAPMTWRLRREEAGSGVIGDLASHAVDQLGFLTGHSVEAVSATTRTFVPERPGPSGPEPVTVEDAAWATLLTDGGVVASLEVSRVAAGRKNGFCIEIYGSQGAIAFDLEHLNQLRVHDAGPSETVGGAGPTAGWTDVMVTEAGHPHLEAWWPTGHVLGWDHTFTNQAADLLRCLASGTDPSPSFEDGLAVQRVLSAMEHSAAEGSRQVPVDDAAVPVVA